MSEREPWLCAGCGRDFDGERRQCNCATGLGFRRSDHMDIVAEQCRTVTISFDEYQALSYAPQAASERDQIVAWIRSGAGPYVEGYGGEIADAIERGDHAPQAETVAPGEVVKRIEDGHADTEGEAMEMLAHLNCPTCGGSGHIDDAAPTPDTKALREALELAANRLDRCAVETASISGTFALAVSEWVDEARAALTRGGKA